MPLPPGTPKGLARMDAALKKMDRATTSFDRLQRRLSRFADLPRGTEEIVARAAVNDIAPDIRDMLLQNLDDSGIGKLSTRLGYRPTGKLRSAVRRTVIGLVMSSRGPVIRLRLPAGIAPYENKSKKGRGTKSNFYTVAASLNYGAIRVPNTQRNVIDPSTGLVIGRKAQDIVGSAAKRSIKKKILTGKISKRAEDAIARDILTPRGRKIRKGVQLGEVRLGTTSGSIQTDKGRIVVIRPRPFFFLSKEQITDISELFAAAVAERLNEFFGRAAA